jgi:hypothetical protein
VEEGALVYSITALAMGFWGPGGAPSDIRVATVRGFSDLLHRRLDAVRVALRAFKPHTESEADTFTSAVVREASAPQSPRASASQRSLKSPFSRSADQPAQARPTISLPAPFANKAANDDVCTREGIPVHHLLLEIRRDAARILLGCAQAPLSQRAAVARYEPAVAPASLVEFVRSCLRVLARQRGTVEDEMDLHTPRSRPADTADGARTVSVLGGTAVDSTLGRSVFAVVGETVELAVVLFCVEAERSGVRWAISAAQLSLVLSRTRHAAGEHTRFLDAAVETLNSYVKMFERR